MAPHHRDASAQRPNRIWLWPVWWLFVVVLTSAAPNLSVAQESRRDLEQVLSRVDASPSERDEWIKSLSDKGLVPEQYRRLVVRVIKSVSEQQESVHRVGLMRFLLSLVSAPEGKVAPAGGEANVLAIDGPIHADTSLRTWMGSDVEFCDQVYALAISHRDPAVRFHSLVTYARLHLQPEEPQFVFSSLFRSVARSDVQFRQLSLPYLAELAKRWSCSLRSYLRSDAYWTVLTAIEVIGLLQDEGMPYSSSLLAILRQDDEDLAGAALIALAQVCPAGSDVCDTVGRATRDARPGVRIASADAVRLSCLKCPHVVQDLVRANVDESDVKVQSQMARGIVRMCAAGTSTMEVVMSYCSDGSGHHVLAQSLATARIRELAEIKTNADAIARNQTVPPNKRIGCIRLLLTDKLDGADVVQSLIDDSDGAVSRYAREALRARSAK